MSELREAVERYEDRLGEQDSAAAEIVALLERDGHPAGLCRMESAVGELKRALDAVQQSLADDTLPANRCEGCDSSACSECRIETLEDVLEGIRGVCLGNGPDGRRKSLAAINHLVGYGLFGDFEDEKWVKRMKDGLL